VQVESCRILKSPRPLMAARAHSRLRSNREAPQSLMADVTVYDLSGRLVAELQGLLLRRVGRAALRLREHDISSCLVELAWEPESNAGVHPLEIVAALQPDLASRSNETGLEHWNVVEPQLDRVCRAYIVRALREFDYTLVPGERIDVAALVARGAIRPGFARLLGRFLDILAADGIVARDAEGWRVLRAPRAADADGLLAALAAEHPAFDAELTFTRRCGPHLAAALSGDCDPLQLLFPG